MHPAIIFGASRNTGLLLARILRSQGIVVHACLRSPDARSELEELGVKVRMGDAMDPKSIAEIFSDLPSETNIISTLGGHSEAGRVDSVGNINLINEAESAGFRRFVLVTSIGCGEMAPYASNRARQAFGHVVAEKTRAEDHLRASRLIYTILRPGGLLNTPATGEGILVQEPAIHGSISREDVALLIARILKSPRSDNQIFACVDRNNCRCDAPFKPYEL